MRKPVDTYATLVFDCDGVVLDSNRVKTEAFRAAALPWGEKAAEALVAHHIAHGGISRYDKFAHFLEQIVPLHAPGRDGPGLEALLNAYATAVRSGLMTCDVTAGLAELRAATPDARWMIVSGGDQAELREIFAARGLAEHFDAGIFGSPDNKDTILAREIAAGNLLTPALFLGDSKYDHQAATSAGLDFVFVSGWSEVESWESFVTSSRIKSVASLSDLCTATDSHGGHAFSLTRTKDGKIRNKNVEITGSNETHAKHLLNNLKGDDLKSFVMGFLFKKNSRFKDKNGQYRVLISFSKDKRLTISQRVYASIAAAHKSIELQDPKLMIEAQKELLHARDLAATLKLSEGIRTDRIYTLFSIMAVDAYLCIFLKDKEGLIRLLEQSLNDAISVDTADLRSSFLQGVINVTFLIGLAFLLRKTLSVKIDDWEALIHSNLSIAIMKQEGRSKPSKVSGTLGESANRIYSAYWEFVHCTPIRYLVGEIINEPDEQIQNDLEIKLMRKCIRHSRLLSDQDLKHFLTYFRS